MKRNIRWAASAAVLLGLLGMATGARAAALPPGSTDVSLTNLGSFTGTLVGDTGGLSYSIGGAGNTGTVREWVVRDATSALCAGCLSFVYQVQVTTGTIGRVAGSPYDTVTVDVAHFGSPVSALIGSVAGGFGANNADRDGTGNTIDFDYTQAITAGSSSFLEIANTNATTFQPGSIGVFTPGLTAGSMLNGFAPGTPTVPEPATVLLLGSGLVALSIWRGRR